MTTESAYRFITNFDISRLKNIRIAVMAANISDYKFCKTAVDVHGNILPNCYALYFGERVSGRDVELFYQAICIVEEKLRERKEKQKW